MRATALELKRFAGLDQGSRRLFRLVWIPYVTAGVFACCAAALNRTMGHGAALGLAAASSFGGGLGILSLPAMQREMTSQARTAGNYLTWSAAWTVAATVVVMAFLFFIGPGLE
jgi:ABC-type phosphate transport system permease subunit